MPPKKVVEEEKLGPWALGRFSSNLKVRLQIGAADHHLMAPLFSSNTIKGLERARCAMPRLLLYDGTHPSYNKRMNVSTDT